MDIIRKKVIIVFILLGASFSLFSQNNPLKLNSLYTADPTARNWGDGKIWLYPSHDVPCMGCYSSMNDYHVFSSSNGVKWRDYGSILSIDKLNQLGWNVHNAWAPDCVYQKGLFYFYFPVQGIVDKKWKIGVVSSKRPMGPFESPSLVVEDWGIDPSVLVDDDGRAYLYCQFKMGELNPDMKTVKEETIVNFSDVASIPYKNYEGPFVFKRKDMYYYVCSAEGYRRLVYFIGKKPLGPWDYKGTIMAPDTVHSENNHCSIVEFKGRWIIFYHRMVCGKSRNVCADFLHFNDDGTIQEVKRTKVGIEIK